MDSRFKLHSFTRQRQDENAMSTNQSAKTIHQRNKSTPALNTFASAKLNSLNPLNPLRRAAFADVSNTRNTAINANTNVKDEGNNKAKSIALELKHFGPPQKDNVVVKPLQAVDVNGSRPLNLMRPLHQPQTAGVNKALPAAPVDSEVVASKPASSIYPGKNQHIATKITDASRQVDHVPARKTIIKRHTTIFRETSIGSTAPVVAKAPVELPIEKSIVEKAVELPLPESSSVASSSQTSHDVPNARSEQPITVVEKLEEVQKVEEILPTIVAPSSGSIVATNLTIPATTASQPPVSTEVASTDARNHVFDELHSLPREYLEYVMEDNRQARESEIYLPALESQEPRWSANTVQEEKIIQPQVILESQGPRWSANTLLDEKVIQPQVITDLEEYWEEEVEEEFFDAEGCVTARSLRSMAGENTTNGVSTVIMPVVTSRVERELNAAKDWIEATGFADITDDEVWDTTMVTEYGDEIFQYMRELENKMMPSPHYMDEQAEIQWSMRSVLVDWVTQVHSRFGLLPETLFLAVNCIDRFLSVKVVSLAKLQLVGATAIYVAAKYEEINCPAVTEIAYMVDGSYTIPEILKAERFMLTMLKFEMGWPGPMSFLRRISKADDYDVETRTLAKYFLEVTLMDERFVGCVPSYLAAGAHCLARLMLGKGDWGAAHVYFSQYTYSQLFPLMNAILICCEAPRTHHVAVFDKYSDKRYKRASTFVETEMSKGFDLPQVARESIGAHSQSFRRK